LGPLASSFLDLDFAELIFHDVLEQGQDRLGLRDPGLWHERPLPVGRHPTRGEAACDETAASAPGW
jgi:hypothetical protein